MNDLYAGEEIQSDLTYPKEYTSPEPIEEQIQNLTEILNQEIYFPIDPKKALAYAKNLPELPDGAEGWFAILSSNATRKICPPRTLNVRWNIEHRHSIELVLKRMSSALNFYNLLREERGADWIDCLRVHAHTAEKLDLIEKDQPGDILIVAAQLGQRHIGRSPRRARECFSDNEFGLTSLAGGCITLTNRNRFAGWDSFDMNFPGDEFNVSDNEECFGFSTVFYHDNREILLKSCELSEACEVSGAATAFLP